MTDHSFISSARLKIAAALAAAVMLAPVTVPAIGAVAAGDTPITRADLDKGALNLAHATLESDYDKAVKRQQSTAYSLLSNSVTARYNKQVDQTKNTLAGLPNAIAAATTQDAVNVLAASVQDAITKLANETKTVTTAMETRTLLARTKLGVAVSNSQKKYNGLTSEQKNSPSGNAFRVAISAARAVAISLRQNPTPNEAAELMDSLTKLGNQATGTLTSDAQRVQTSLNRLNDLAKTTPVFLLNLSDYKNSQATISTVQKAINDGKANTAAEANVLISQINTSYNNLSNAIKRALSFTGVGTINYVPKYGIQVWTWDGKLVMMDNDKTKAKKLQHGTRWKIFGDIINQNGSRMYNLGGDQFIDANFIDYKANK